MKVLVVDDNKELNNTIKAFLELKNYDVTSVYTGIDAIDSIDNNNYDLFIVDIQLPKISGIEIIKKIRQKSATTPIIMVTASNDIDYLVQSFEFGCNEFIKKPFHLRELEIRLQNIIHKQLIQIDENLEFDALNEELIIDNIPIKLRKKEKRLLHLLIKNNNSVVATEELNNYIWENKEMQTYPLRQLVSTLKKRIPQIKTHIITISGVGYKLQIS